MYNIPKVPFKAYLDHPSIARTDERTCQIHTFWLGDVKGGVHLKRTRMYTDCGRHFGLFHNSFVI